MGRGHAEGAGDRSLVADRDRLVHRRQSGRASACCRSSTARPTVPMPGYDVRIVDEAVQRAAARTRWARSSSSCRCRPPACRRCGSRTSASRKAISASSPATTRPPTPASWTRTATSTIMGRTDDIINVAGHRLSTGGMEEVLASHRDVAECAVIGIKDELKGEVPCGFVVLKAGVNRPPSRDREGNRRAGAREDRPGRRLQARGHGRRACRRRAPARSCAAP